MKRRKKIGKMPATLFPMAPREMTMTQIFMSEFVGTTVLLFLDGGAVATSLLPKPKGRSGGWLLINWGQGLAALAGTYVAYGTSGHPNPVVAITKVAGHMFNPKVILNDPAPAEGGIPVIVINVVAYTVAEFLGAFVGTILCWLTFRQHFGEDPDPALKLGVFSTAPEIRSYGQSTPTEVIGIAVFIPWVRVSGYTQTAVGPLVITLVIIVIGNSPGGPTGYVINSARSLGPRIAHAILPIKGKGGSNWGYSQAPVAGPTIGAIVGTIIIFVTGLA